MLGPIPLSALQASPRRLPQCQQSTRVNTTFIGCRAASSPPQPLHDDAAVNRRTLLTAAGASVAMLSPLVAWARASTQSQAAPTALPPVPGPVLEDFLNAPLDYSGPGPLAVAHLPKMETFCKDCSTVCAGTNCLLRVEVTYPKGGAALGMAHPYPLAIFSAGFLVGADMYRSYAERLASWGYTVILYDKMETVGDSLDDVTSVTAMRHLMDWAGTHPLVSQVADPSSVYLIGHSRGGKLSALAAAVDHRVAAVCLLDPVDNTIYAPIAPGYPSAVEALRNQCDGPTAALVASSPAPAAPLAAPLAAAFASPAAVLAAAASATSLAAGPAHAATAAAALTDTFPASQRAADIHNCAAPNVLGGVPVAIVGSGLSGDCAPQESNYRRFFDAAPGPTWEVEIASSGHFEYLDPVMNPTTSFQKVLCPAGSVPDAVVRDISQTVMVAWGELMLKRRDPSLMMQPAKNTYLAGSNPAIKPPGLSAMPSLWPAGGSTSLLGTMSLTHFASSQAEPAKTEVATTQVVLEKLANQMRYEGQLADVGTRYKNF